MNVCLKFALLFVFIVNVFGEDLIENDSTVSTFEERISLRILCNYNHISVQNFEYIGENITSNRPVDLGVGFGYDSLFYLLGSYWDFSFDFIYALPFTADNKSKSNAFEMGLNFFPENWWLETRIRRYSGFTATEYINLTMTDLYFSALWMATAKGKFSPRSAYFLDRRQKHSAGSMIIGGKLQRNYATTDILKRRINSVWIDMGYSYTWIYSGGMFINGWSVLGLAYGKRSNENDVVLLPEADLRFSTGYMGEKWSWNIVLKTDYSPVIFNKHTEIKVVSSFEILVVRRF